MRATQTLPDSYHSIGTLDLAKNRRLLVIVNIAALVILMAAGWLFFRAMVWMRPDALMRLNGMQIIGLTGGLLLIAQILGLTASYIIIHEAIHGIFFWLFTRSRPRFALKLTYAYAAAPDWYIPRSQFLITTLAPFVVITLIGLAIFATAPFTWLLPTLYVISMNASGAVGDLMVGAWLLRQPAACFAQDRGDAVTLYVPD